MRRHRQALLTVFLFTVLCIFACVTVNIYFPAEKVESVAGEIVTDIRTEKKSEPESSQQSDKISLPGETLYRLTCSLVWAEEEVTTVSNAKIRGLKEQMKRRYGEMKPYYRKGMVKEGDNGYVFLGNTDALNLKERRDLNNLVDAENKDRAELYLEVAKALQIDSSQVSRVAEIFAKEWQKY